MANANRVALASLSNGMVETKIGGVLAPAVGASVMVYVWGSSRGTQATVFAAETGGTTLTQPLTTDSNGLVPGWVADGQDVDIVATYLGVTSGDSQAEPAITTGPIVPPTSPRNRALRDFVSLLDYGTYVTSDMSSVYAAARADAMTRSKMLFVPSNVYAIDNPGTAQNTSNKGPLIIKGDDPTTTVFTQSTAAQTDSIVRTIGTSVNLTTLTSPASAGSNVLTVASTTGIVADEMLFLRDTSQFIGATGIPPTSTQIVGEFARVYSVDSSTQLTLHGVLDFSYTTSAAIASLIGQKVHVSGVGFTNLFPQTQTQVFISIAYAEDARVENCEFNYADEDGVVLQRAFDIRITDCRFLNFQELTATGSQDAGRTPYEINLDQAIQNALISGCISRYGRHFITASGGTASEFGTAHVHVNDCIAVEHAASSFDTHPGARNWTFTDCYAHNTMNDLGPATASVHGFQIRGPDTTLNNCRVHNLAAASGGTIAAYGILIYAGAHRARIQGCEVDTADYGIWVADADDVYIGANTKLANIRQTPIVLQYDTSWSPNITNPVRLGEIHFKNVPSGSPINANQGALTFPVKYVA